MDSPIPFNGKGVFAKMKFPDYVFQEYPKIVDTPDGKRVTVQNQREELELASKSGLGAKPSQAEVDRDRLAAVAAEKDDVISAKDKEIEELRRQLQAAAGGVPVLTKAEAEAGAAISAANPPEPTTAELLEQLTKTPSRVVAKR